MSDPSRTPSPKFTSHLQAPSPVHLHHYTGQDGLIGIVEKQELWATKIQYLNDATEFEIGLNMAREVIAMRKRLAPEHEHLALETLAPHENKFTWINIFISCFCEKSDLLSQWRGYSGDSYGYSMALRTDRLRAFARKSGFTLGKCIYDRAGQKQIIDELITHSLRIPHAGQRQAEFEDCLISVSPFFKDETFRDEHEWRIVSITKDSHDENIGFRKGSSTITPYFRAPIGDATLSAITGVTVGPCPHPKRAVAAIHHLFIHTGLAKRGGYGRPGYNSEINISSVPYRNW